MKTLKDIILEKIEKIEQEENIFESSYWEDVYFSYQNHMQDAETKLISKIRWEDLNDEDLIRGFEFIILMRNDISKDRVEVEYYRGDEIPRQGNIAFDKEKNIKCLVEMVKKEGLIGGLVVLDSTFGESTKSPKDRNEWIKTHTSDGRYSLSLKEFFERCITI